MISRQQAAAAREAAAKSAEAQDRLSALEVERNGYVQRGDKNGIKAVDEEIARWSRRVGVHAESGTTAEPPPSSLDELKAVIAAQASELETARASLEERDAQLKTATEAHADAAQHLTAATDARDRLLAELDELKATADDASAGADADADADADASSTPKPRGRAKTAAAAKD